jgi:hypothetical protein
MIHNTKASMPIGSFGYSREYIQNMIKRFKNKLFHNYHTTTTII